MKLNTIIVEDSQDNMEVLQFFLKKYCSQVNVIGTAGNINEAEQEIRNKRPDLVFLDIVLEDRNSFELLEKLENEEGISFLIIFVTAHPRFEFAEKAIDYSAIAYLTKPFDKEKLKFAVKKAMRLQPKFSLDLIRSKIEELQPSPAADNPPFLSIYKVNSVIKTVRTEELSHLVADKDMTQIYLTDGSYTQSNRPLSFYQQKLEDDPSFFRIHNSTLVNINEISEMNKRDNLLQMRTGARLNCSRRMGKALYEYLQEV